MKIYRYIFIPLLLLIIFSSCKSSGKKGAGGKDSLSFVYHEDADTFRNDWSKYNTLVIHSISEPDMLHPVKGISADRSMIFNLIHRNIISTDIINIGLRPDLIEAMPMVSSDGLAYTYTLGDSLYWDDGLPVTNEDVLFTLKVNMLPLTSNISKSDVLSNVENVDVVGNSIRTFRISMKKPYILNTAFLADIPIIERKLFDPKNLLSKISCADISHGKYDMSDKKNSYLDEWAKDFNDASMGRAPEKLPGLGPYKLFLWDEGVQMILVKKKNGNSLSKSDSSSYTKAFPDTLIFKINRDMNAVKLAFLSQLFDVTTYVSSSALSELQENNAFNLNYHSEFVQTLNYTFMAMNMKPDGIKQKPFFTDVKVRKAMSMLVPADDIIQLIDKGKSKRVTGPVSNLKKEHNNSLLPISYDIIKARKLLDEAGWKDCDGDQIRDKLIKGKKISFEFTLKYFNTTPEWKDIAMLISESCAKAGVVVRLEPLDVDILIHDASNHQFDALLSVWATGAVPEDYTQLWHTASWTSNGANYTGFGNATSDALIDSIKATIDNDSRIKMVKRFQKILYDERPYVFIKSGVRKVIIHKRFGNAHMYHEKPGVLLNFLRLLYKSPGVYCSVSGH